MEYARRYGAHIAGLILCCTTPAMDYSDVIMANAQARSTPEQLSLVIKAFTEPLTSDAEMQVRYGAILSLYFKSYDPAIGRGIVNNIHYNHHAFNFCITDWFSSFNSMDWLGDIKVPTLVIGGREDWIMPPAQGAERLHARIPGSKLAIFENSGHFPFIEEPEAFNALVAGWTAGLRSI